MPTKTIMLILWDQASFSEAPNMILKDIGKKRKSY
jgi:hypothetical protein